MPKPEREIRRREERSPDGSRKGGAEYKRVQGYRLAWADEPAPAAESDIDVESATPEVDGIPEVDEPEPVPSARFRFTEAAARKLPGTLSGLAFEIISSEVAEARLEVNQRTGFKRAMEKLTDGVYVQSYGEDGTPYRIMAVPRAALEPVPVSAVEPTPEPEPTSEPELFDDFEADVPEDEDALEDEADDLEDEVDPEVVDEPVDEVDALEDEADDPEAEVDDDEANLARRIAAHAAADIRLPNYVLEQLTDPKHPIHRLGMGEPFWLPEAFASRMEVYKLLSEGDPLKATLRAFGLDSNAWQQNHILLYFERGDVQKPKLRLLNKTAFNPARDSIPFPEDF